MNAALSTLSVWNVSAQATYPVGPNLTGLWAIAVLVPTLAVTVRRLRSTGRSWANLFWLLLPIAGLIIFIVLCAQPDRMLAHRIQCRRRRCDTCAVARRVGAARVIVAAPSTPGSCRRGDPAGSMRSRKGVEFHGT